MGGLQSCDTQPKEAEAVSTTANKPTAFRWWGLHVLSADCQKSGKGEVYYTKQLNIFGIITISLVLLIVLWLVMKMMHKKDAGFPSGLQ